MGVRHFLFYPFELNISKFRRRLRRKSSEKLSLVPSDLSIVYTIEMSLYK